MLSAIVSRHHVEMVSVWGSAPASLGEANQAAAGGGPSKLDLFS